MTKYTSNEQYEKCKANWLYHFKTYLNEGLELDALDVVDIFNLLKQSKWIGADDIAQPLNYVDEITSSFKLQKAIEEAIEKAVEKAVEKVLKSKI